MLRIVSVMAIVTLTVSPTAWAQDISLIIGNEDYANISDVRRADEVTSAVRVLNEAGLQTIALSDASAEEIQQAMSSFGQMANTAERQLVVLSGRFVHSQTETYFLPADFEAQPLATVSSSALPLSVILAYLASTQGHSILAIATDDEDGAFGPHLTFGTGQIDLPQGVTMLRGAPRNLARFIRGTLAEPGANIAEAAASARISVSGYLASDQSFLDMPPPEQAVAEAPAVPTDQRIQDLRAWRSADSANTPGAYQTYIDEFPNGEFVRMAENRLQALTDTPELRAERTEQALDLDRDQRREIQRDLSLLDYNTRGIDGIFGRGTRAAVKSWQEANGFEASGFLSGDQITRLDAQAERRAAELEAEAERRREEQLARDSAFWSETGAVGDEAGYRLYLERFPDGEFAEVARARLDEIERQKRAETDARDRQLWDEASAQNTIESYRDYLDIAPNGAFREVAVERINALEKAAREADANSQAAREEQALNLNTTTRRVSEGRLDRLNLKPGRVDGTFDDDTRRAIRRYQAARNRPETGFLNEALVIQLLADSVRSIFQ